MAKKRSSGKFPLFQHANGQWAKKVRGRTHYFGTDKDKALEEYVRVREDLEAGRMPREKREGVKLSELANVFLSWKLEKVKAGELSPRSWDEYHAIAERLIDHFGKDRMVDDLRPADFGKLRAEFSERAGPTTLLRLITLTKTIFSFAWKAELIPVPLRYGTFFDKPPKRVMRLERHRKGEQLVSAADFWKLHEAADVQGRAMLLLGINCAFGSKDCSDLPQQALKVKPGWIVFPRPKSGIGRRAPLWPETQEALELAIHERYEPRSPEDADLVFITMHKHRWVRRIEREGKRGLTLDPWAQAYAKLVKKTGIKTKGGPYTIRRTFRTVADSAKDEPAIDVIMGHSSDDTMGGIYRQNIDDDRLEKVSNHVRSWLMAGR